MTNKEMIKAIIKQYADKGERLYNESCETKEDSQTIGYWDGYRDCANLLLRELEDVQEEPKECMYSKDNYTDEDRKALCDGCEEECEFNKKEESVSEDLNTVAKEYANNITDKIGYRLQLRRAVCFGAKWQKEQMEKNRLKHCNNITNEQAELEQGFIDQHLDKYQRMPTFLDAIEYGMKLKEQQMVAKAVEVTIAIPYQNGYGGYIQLVNSKEALPFGDKLKVLVIKED